MTDDSEPTFGGDSRRARGVAMYRKVYGDGAVEMPPGVPFFDLMMEDLFGDVWTRPGLAIEERRLLVMGVLAAQHEFDTLGIQFARALEAEELTADQVREVVIQLIPYVGYPSSGSLYRVSETAIAQQGNPT
jgi:4-carboxymuconolactone decarboxylase